MTQRGVAFAAAIDEGLALVRPKPGGGFDNVVDQIEPRVVGSIRDSCGAIGFAKEADAGPAPLPGGAVPSISAASR